MKNLPNLVKLDIGNSSAKEVNNELTVLGVQSIARLQHLRDLSIGNLEGMQDGTTLEMKAQKWYQ